MANDNDLIRRGGAALAVLQNFTETTQLEAIAALPAVTVGVKPLVWEQLHADYHVAETPFGAYEAAGEWYRGPDRRVQSRFADPFAAAQADYEARILAALEPVTPAPDGAPHVNEPSKIEHDAGNVLTDAAAIREAERQKKQRVSAMRRRHINAPEDTLVAALCERYGYGAVMDAASRLWARKDSVGAFYIGGCIGLRSDDEAAALITEKPHDR